jgi:biopolymer transport protein ExbD
LDVVFILLIFFAVSTSFLYIGGINVNLPKAETTEETDAPAVEVALTKEGEIFINSRKVTLDALAESLRAAFEADSKTVLVIQADKQSLHGLLVEIIDTGRLVGFERFAIATEK